MASKILFIEDQLEDITKVILQCLRDSGLIKLEEFIKLRQLTKQGDNPIEPINKSEILKDKVEFAESFGDALERIKKAGNGFDYRWFFIDRNLEYFDDKKSRFDSKFCDFFKGKEGDYLYIRLRQAGVPDEKICFLTANGEENPFASSDFFDHSDPQSKPQVIMKNTAAGKQPGESSTSDGKAPKKLVEYLRSAGPTKIRFKYKKIFGNQKIKAILGKKMEDFIELMARSEYPEGAAGFKFDEGDGILLRNMIEWVVATLSGKTDEDISVRHFLNDSANGYSSRYRQPLDIKSWVHWYKRKGCQLPTKDNITEDDLKNQEDWFSKNTSNNKWKTPHEMTEDYFNRIFCISMWIEFHLLLNDLSSNPDIIPKYIFSYIDNIYTVTSEWSAHGGNPTRVTDLSAEGFRALVYGMCQILDWFADKYPNQPQPTENNQ